MVRISSSESGGIRTIYASLNGRVAIAVGDDRDSLTDAEIESRIVRYWTIRDRIDAQVATFSAQHVDCCIIECYGSDLERMQVRLPKRMIAPLDTDRIVIAEANNRCHAWQLIG